MNIHFDRFRTQEKIEQLLGCYNLENWKDYKFALSTFSTDDTNKDLLLDYLKEDTKDTYFKGIFSLLDALNDLHNGYSSWPVIKIYYSIYYFIRCYLATNNLACIKNNGFFVIPILGGQTKKFNEKGDHKCLIKAFENFFPKCVWVLNHIVTDNKPVNIFKWLMEYREIVNYRSRSFSEPDLNYFNIDLEKLSDWVETYLNDDDYKFCFLKDHCLIAAPVRFAYDTRGQLERFLDISPETNSLLDESKIKVLEKLVKSAKIDNSVLNKLM